MIIIFKGKSIQESLDKFNFLNQITETLWEYKDVLSKELLKTFAFLIEEENLRNKYLVRFDYNINTNEFVEVILATNLGKKINQNNWYFAAPEFMISQYFDENYTEGISDAEIQNAIALKELEKTWIPFPIPKWFTKIPIYLINEFITFIGADLIE